MPRAHRLVRTGAALLVAGAALGAAAALDARPVRAADDAATTPAADRAPRDVAAEIDRLVAAAWDAEGVAPNRPCTDEEFVRRAHLDVVGTIPTAAQVETFLADPSPAKRERLVDDLLASPGFARHFANRWADVLVGAGTGDDRRDFVPGLFLKWLETQLAADRPFADWTREMLTAQGSPYTNPAVNFTTRKEENPADLAGTVSKAFLGVQIQCAQCHDHPYEDIRQTEFQAFSAFWGRLRIQPADIPYEMFGPRAVEAQRQRFDRDVAEMTKTGVPEAEARAAAERRKLRTRDVSDWPGDARAPRVFGEARARVFGEAARATPKFLKGPTYADRAGETRREALAKWITDPANPFTARALSNRVWGWLLGRGVVHPVDDFTASNRPSVAGVLDVLAADTAAHGFDVKRLVRIVTATRAYRTTTAAPSRPRRAAELFACGPLKPLTPQQSFDALKVALGVVADGRTLTLEDAGPAALEMEGGRLGLMRMAEGDDDGRPDAAKLALTRAAQGFFQTFDDDEGNSDAAFEGTVPQGLFLLNGRVVNAMLSDSRVSVVPRVLAEGRDDAARVRALHLRTLSREPTAEETARFVRFVREASAEARPAAQRGKGRRGRREPDAVHAAWADALWVLVASSEFGANH